MKLTSVKINVPFRSFEANWIHFSGQSHDYFQTGIGFSFIQELFDNVIIGKHHSWHYAYGETIGVGWEGWPLPFHLEA